VIDSTVDSVAQQASTAVRRPAHWPHWAQPLPVPPPPAAGPALQVLLADTQLWAGPEPAYLIQRVEQVHDASALGHIGQLRIDFNPRYQQLLLHAVRIRRGDAWIDHTANVSLQCLQREAGLEQGVVSGLATATMVLPDVRVGDTLHLAYTVQGENPIFGGRYAGWAGWDQPHPIAHRHVSIAMPIDRCIHWRWLGDRPGERPLPLVQQADGVRRLCFSGTDLAAIGHEPFLPREAHPLRWLQFSEFAGWAEVAEWAAGLFPSDAPLPCTLLPLRQRLAALPDQQQQVCAALQWVQREIRYHSLALGEGSHRPRPPSEVVAQRYGDCKDKSLLLVVLLRSLGIAAWPALAAAQTRSAPLKLLPSPEAFDHVVVWVELQGRPHCIDPTRLGQDGPLSRLGQGLEDAAVLVVRPDTDALQTVRSAEREQLFGNELHERYVVEDLHEGHARLSSEQHWHGLGAESLRAMLLGLDAAQLRQWALGRYERRHPGITLEDTPELAHDRELNRLTVRARYRVPRALRRSEEGCSLRCIAANLLAAFLLPESLCRSLPLAVPSFPGRLVHVLELHWPEDALQADLPANERLDTPHLQLQVARTQRGPLARQTAVLQARVPQVPAEEVPALADSLQQLDTLLHRPWTVLAPPPRPAQPLPLAQRWAQQRQQQAERAARAIARGHLQGEDLAQAQLLQAQALLELGRAADALAQAEQALAHAPALACAWATRGRVHWALARFDVAAADFSRALQLDGDPAPLYLQRGQARFYAGLHAQAAADFERAARCALEPPARAQAQLWQAWARQRDGQPSALDPAHTGWPVTGWCLLLERPDPAALLTLASSHPGDAAELALLEAWFMLGQHHLAHRRLPAARRAFEQVRARGTLRLTEHVAAGFELERLQHA